MKCYVCGKTFPDDSDFCPYCGAQIKASNPVEKETTACDTLVYQATASIPNKKKRYCKICGAQIDSESKTCTGCGKHYFRNPLKRINKKIALLIAAVLLFVSLAGLNIYQYARFEKEYVNFETELAAREQKITEQEQQIADLNETIHTDKIRILQLHEANQFMENYVAIVPDNGTGEFHKFGCEDLNLAFSKLYYIEDAIEYGYIPCIKCCPNEVQNILFK